MKTKILLVSCLLLCLAGFDSARAQTAIVSDAFDASTGANSATGWQVQVTGATVTTPANGLSSNSYLSSALVTNTSTPRVSVFPATGALQLTLGLGSPTSGGVRDFISPAYPVPAGTTRALVAASIHCSGLAAEDASLTLVEVDSSGNATWVQGGLDFSNTADQTDFIRILPVSNWIIYRKIAELKSTTVKLYVEIVIRNNARTSGTIWIDDVSVLTNTSTNYLMEAWSGAEGNVFQGTSGTVQIYPYDSRGGTPTFSVVNENGTAISPQSTVTAHTGFYSVALSGKGYYNIEATAPGQTASSFTSTILSTAAPVATSPYGDDATTNPLSPAAGGNWNRFFIDTLAIRQNTDGSFISGSNGSPEAGYPAPVDFQFLPTNQKFDACGFTVPEPMASYPSTYTAGLIYPPSSWTQYQQLVTYILQQLPPSVQDIEVFNEPEWNYYNTSDPNMAYNIEMMFKTVHDAVVALRASNGLQNPNLKIIGPSFAHFYSPKYPDGKSALQDTLFKGNLFAGDTGLLTYVDEISMHGYGADTTLLEPEAEFYDRIWQWEQHERSLSTPGLTTTGVATGPLKPIHMTEFGWEIGTGAQNVTELNRAAYVSRAMIITRAMMFARLDPTTGLASGAIPFASIEPFSMCYFNSASGAPWSVLNPWSMLNLDYSPFATYTAYSTVAQALGGVDHAGAYINTVPTLPNDPGCNYQVASFETASTGATVTCLWSSGANLAMHIPSTVTFTATDYMGRPLTVTSGGTLTITNTPVFLAATGFFSGPAPTTITVTHGTTIPTTSLPAFADILCPSTFTIAGTAPNLTLQAPSTAGTYKVMVKVESTWTWYKIVAN